MTLILRRFRPFWPACSLILGQPTFDGTATNAAKDGDQLSLFDIELCASIRLPLVEPASAECFSLMFFRGLGLFKGDDIAHGASCLVRVRKLKLILGSVIFDATGTR